MPRQVNKELVAQLTVETIPELSFEEICLACQAPPEFVIQLVEYGTLEPAGYSIDSWCFYPEDLRILRVAMHLYHDLEINHAGIALIMDMMQELAELRSQLDILQRQMDGAKF